MIRSIFPMLAVVLGLLALSPLEAAPPAANAAPNLSAADTDKLPAGQFAGTLLSLPDSDRIFKVKITYPEVRLKPGARLPSGGNVRTPYVQNINRELQQVQRLQQQMVQNTSPHQAIHNMVQMQQAYLQMQLNLQRLAQQQAQLMVRIQQQQARAEQQLLAQELRLLQQQIKAIQNLYQVVPVSREVDFQSEEHVKVRTLQLPQEFDDKGNVRKYTRKELLDFKGKDKALIGYESSVEALKVGQVVIVALRPHQKAKPAAAPEAHKDEEAAFQHKMQVKLIVIVQDGETTSKAKK